MSAADTIRDYIEEFVLYGDKLESDDASLVASGMIDSTGAMELVGFVEDTYGIEIPNNEIGPENLDTVNLIVALVERHLGPVLVPVPNDTDETSVNAA